MARPRFRIEQAKAWLREELQDGKEHWSFDVRQEAEQVGIAWRTLQLAGEELEQAGEMRRWMQYKPERRWLWQNTREEVTSE